MKHNPIIKTYWGIGLENETYLQFEESLVVTGQFIREKMGRERYSIDYLKCYKKGSLEAALAAAFDNTKREVWKGLWLRLSTMEKTTVSAE